MKKNKPKTFSLSGMGKGGKSRRYRRKKTRFILRLRTTEFTKGFDPRLSHRATQLGSFTGGYTSTSRALQSASSSRTGTETQALPRTKAHGEIATADSQAVSRVGFNYAQK